MKKSFLLFFLFVSAAMLSQENLSDIELELIQLSLEKSYSLKNANNDLTIDSIETKAIKQNFIPTLTMNGGYAYGQQVLTLISQHFHYLFQAPKFLMENLSLMQRVIFSMRT